MSAGSGPRPAQAGVIGAGVVLLLVGAGWLGAHYSRSHAALFLVGAGCGLVLYHAAFGFTTAFRVFATDGDGRGLRAQMLMLAGAAGGGGRWPPPTRRWWPARSCSPSACSWGAAEPRAPSSSWEEARRLRGSRCWLSSPAPCSRRFTCRCGGRRRRWVRSRSEKRSDGRRRSPFSSPPSP